MRYKNRTQFTLKTLSSKESLFPVDTKVKGKWRKRMKREKRNGEDKKFIFKYNAFSSVIYYRLGMRMRTKKKNLS